MKDSKNADTEIALGVGATSAVLLETGVIASEGFVTGMVTQLGTATGLTVLADCGTGVAALCGALGPVGWTVAGIAGFALIAHGIYRIV